MGNPSQSFRNWMAQDASIQHLKESQQNFLKGKFTNSGFFSRIYKMGCFHVEHSNEDEVIRTQEAADIEDSVRILGAQHYRYTLLKHFCSTNSHILIPHLLLTSFYISILRKPRTVVHLLFVLVMKIRCLLNTS